MDNLCHTLAGAALGDAGLKRRSALGMSTLLIASNLPDIDVAVFATDMLPMYVRRGVTHGVIAMAILPAVLAVFMLAWQRGVLPRLTTFAKATAVEKPGPSRISEGQDLSPGRPFTLREILLLSYIGTWLHVFMDFLNSYGVRLLSPFSQRWFYGDALYIVDPLLYLFLGGAVAWGRLRKESRHIASGRAARVGLAVAAVYAVLMLASNLWARGEVRQQLVRAGQDANTRFMVTPVFGNPLRREVIVDLGARYEKGFVWFEPAPHFRPAGYGVPTNEAHPLAIAALTKPRVQDYLIWSRFPFFQIDATPRGPRVLLNDYRYAGPAGFGWSAMEVQ